MAQNNGRSYIAGGTIAPCRFVKPSTSADNTVLAAGANERTIGISQIGTHDTPGLTGAGTQAASATNPIEVGNIGDIRMLELGGTVTAGDLIKSGAAGVGITSATSGATMQWVGAQALASGVSGEFIPVIVLPPTPYYPALS